MEIGAELDLVHAHFFFVDIVGLSNPEISTRLQVNKIKILSKCISECKTYKSVPRENIIKIPTGDGIALGFLQGPQLILTLAIELQKKLAEYNKGKIPTETIHVRIGLNSGNVFMVDEEVSEKKTIWGPGIVLARRVMDIGDEDHILLSPRTAEDLREISDDYKKIIKPVRDYEIKHGKTILVYSVYSNDFGNPNPPKTKGVQTTKFDAAFLNMIQHTIYPSLLVELDIIDPITMLVRHKRTYEIKNTSDEPINNVLHGIGTDVPIDSIEDLKMRVYDEESKEMKILSVNLDKPYQKEFTTNFNRPVLKNDEGRKYTLEYEVKEPERYFENAFLTDCSTFRITLKYPSNSIEKIPTIFFINQETREKRMEDPPRIEISKDCNVLKWVKKDVSRGETYRLEW